jgi:hypothetical protein
MKAISDHKSDSSAQGYINASDAMKLTGANAISLESGSVLDAPPVRAPLGHRVRPPRAYASAGDARAARVEQDYYHDE